MHKASIWSTAVSVVSALFCLVLAGLWLSVVHVEALKAPDQHQYGIDALALIVTVLGVVIALVFAVSAIMAIFGYVEIKRAAENMALKTATEVANRVADQQMKSFLAQRRREQTVTSDVQQSPPPTGAVSEIK